MNSNVELKFSRFLATGLFLITCLVIAGPLTDPVNVPKFLVLVVMSFGLIPFLFINRDNIFKHVPKSVLIFSAIFLVASLTSTILSKSPFNQTLYGTYGRNTGLLAYIGFLILFLTLSSFTMKSSFNSVIYAFIIAGAVNVIYGFIVTIFGDPIPWINNYGGLLGTFGNPNFSGAFYGMVSTGFLIFSYENRYNSS